MSEMTVAQRKRWQVPFEAGKERRQLVGICFKCKNAGYDDYEFLYDPYSTRGYCPNADCNGKLRPRWLWICPEILCSLGFKTRDELRYHEHQWI